MTDIGFCIICRKNLLYNNVSECFCGHFCNYLYYYRQRFGVSPQPMTQYIYPCTNILEMRCREMAAKEEYNITRNNRNLGIP